MAYEEGLFLRMSPAEIIRRVAASDPSLAIVSAMTVVEQIRIGWLGNPVIETLYSLTSAGVWIARTDTSGYQVADGVIIGNVNASRYSTLSGLFPTVKGGILGEAYAEAIYLRQKVKVVPFTLTGGGTLADLQLVAHVDGYYPVIDSMIIVSANAVAGGLTFAFESPAGTAIRSQKTSALVAYVPNESFKNTPVYKETDDADIVADISDGAGGETGLIIVTYHHET